MFNRGKKDLKKVNCVPEEDEEEEKEMYSRRGRERGRRMCSIGKKKKKK